MVPDKFNMVDMGGIDLIMAQGEEIPGLYERLMESIALCRYQCLYNWMFDGVNIPPTYVQMTVDIETENVKINEGVEVDVDDVIYIHSLEPPPVEPIIIPLSVEENGEYSAPEGVDGYSPVVVNVPVGPIEPTLPSEYQEVEYITFYGNEYLFVENLPSNYLMHILASNSVSAAESCVVGYREATVNNADFEARFANGDFNVWARASANTSQAMATYPTGTALNTVRELMCSCFNHARGKFFIGRYSESTPIPFKGNLNFLTLYAGRQAGVPQSFSPIWKFIPCYRKSDNEVGLYEVYHSVFYTNQGTGDLGKGPDVN